MIQYFICKSIWAWYNSDTGIYIQWVRCVFFLLIPVFCPCMLSSGAGAAPGVSIDLVADFQYLRTAYAIDTNLKFSDNLFAALSRFYCHKFFNFTLFCGVFVWRVTCRTCIVWVDIKHDFCSDLLLLNLSLCLSHISIYTGLKLMENKQNHRVCLFGCDWFPVGAMVFMPHSERCPHSSHMDVLLFYER